LSPPTSFPYQSATPGGRLRPYLTLEVTGPNGVVHRVRGLIDTGADFSLFPSWYAQRLGFDKTLLREGAFGGASGPGHSRIGDRPCLAHVVDIFSHDAVELLINASFVSDLSTALWGRLDFMVSYDLTIMESQKRFVVSPAQS
jgi:hypothetical protein